MTPVHAVVAFVLLVFVGVAHADAFENRQLYEQALKQLAAGNADDFHATEAKLEGYVLYSYLEYAELRNRLRSATAEQIRAFRTRNADSPLADRLNDWWLLELSRRGAWQQYLEFYQRSDNVQLECLYLRALDHRGEHEQAMAGVAALWLAASSQPNDCDPLFSRWMTEGHLTFGMVWDRLTLVLQAGEWQLARYLISLLDSPQRQQAELFYRVYRDPARVEQTHHFSHDNEQIRDILSYGLRRLAMSDPDAAAAAWQHYRDHFDFSTDTRRIIAQDLAVGFARNGIIESDVDLAPSPDGRELLVFEAQLAAAIGQQMWPTVVALINRLAPAERSKPRWQYWLGRAQRQVPHPADDPPDDPWVELANQRHYYGFLAAQRLGTAPRMNDKTTKPNKTAAAALRALPAMQRISELYAVDDLADARREWSYLSSRLTDDQLAAAAMQLADMGWMYQSIMAANQADLRNDLSLRFPAPYMKLFRTASHATAVPLSFLYGITRQESAFAPAARSMAGAIGLMQLMPATASATARNSGQSPPDVDALYRPDVNVRLGSQHLAELLEIYHGNRVLAAAAYNAGRQRVDRWLEDRPAVPADVWIETIPFAETRNYVMNVLAFSYVYGRRLGHAKPFLGPAER